VLKGIKNKFVIKMDNCIIQELAAHKLTAMVDKM